MEAGGLEPPSQPLQTIVNKEVKGRSDADLSSCLSFLRRYQPDLAAVAEGWETLPAAMKAGILAMVRAAR